MTITFKNYCSSLDFLVIQSPFPSKYPSPYHIPDGDDIGYDELDEIAITFVDDLPSDLLEFLGQEFEGKHMSNGEFESYTHYLIEPVFDSGMYLIRQYTFYQ